MLPLMAASVVAYFVARSARVGSMYEITVQRQERHDERRRLRGQRVRDLLEPAQTVVGPDAGVEEMGRLFRSFPVKYLYVVDAGQRFLGVVPLKSLGAGAGAGSATTRLPPTAADLLTDELEPLLADTDLETALRSLLQHRGERLPVVESADHPVLLGVVSKTTVLATYVRLSE